jgi:hypothetical protein
MDNFGGENAWKYVNVFQKSKKDDVRHTKKFNSGIQDTLLKTSNLN